MALPMSHIPSLYDFAFLLETSLLFLLISWFVVKRNIKKELVSISGSVEGNRYMLFLQYVLHLIKMYFYALLTALGFVVLVVLFKLIFLQQFSKLSLSNYMFDVDKMIKKMLNFTTNPHTQKIHLVAFVLVLIIGYISIVFTVPHADDDVSSSFNALWNCIPVVILAVFVFLSMKI